MKITIKRALFESLSSGGQRGLITGIIDYTVSFDCVSKAGGGWNRFLSLLSYEYQLLYRVKPAVDIDYLKYVSGKTLFVDGRSCRASELILIESEESNEDNN